MEILDYFTERPEKIIIVNIDKRILDKIFMLTITFCIPEFIFIILNQKTSKTLYDNVQDHKKICELVNKTLEELNYDNGLFFSIIKKVLH